MPLFGFGKDQWASHRSELIAVGEGYQRLCALGDDASKAQSAPY
jgi:hypothetical protein